MSIYLVLTITSWIIFILTVFVGYGICHFILTPLLLKKHRNRGFVESSFWEGIQAENHLKDLLNETNDPMVQFTYKTIKYSKILIVVSLIAMVSFAILNGIQ